MVNTKALSLATRLDIPVAVLRVTQFLLPRKGGISWREVRRKKVQNTHEYHRLCSASPPAIKINNSKQTNSVVCTGITVAAVTNFMLEDHGRTSPLLTARLEVDITVLLALLRCAF
jgi:hypothetical protein